MSDLHLFNSLTKKLEKFVPTEENKVKMYICGPTVYDSPHIGHARTYISFDIIRRILSSYFKYDLTFVMNITNIDDKIIARAAERKISCEELSNIYEKEFFDEMEKLNVIRPDFVTRVTEYVPEIIKFIEKLVSSNLAYESNGSVYFDLNEYKKKFQYNLFRCCVNIDEIESSDKKSKDDFALWKASKGNELAYPSPWGDGRPGWHIECSVMASSILGNKLDIHAGGIDLAFPHHENEIAQCQGYFQENWVKYFLHTGHLNINGLKMSKSLKNFLTIKDIINISSPNHLRILFLQHFWNKDMNYDPDQLKEAGSILKKVFNFISNAESLIKRNDSRVLNDLDRNYNELLDQTKVVVDLAFKDIIDTPKALNAILDLISKINIDVRVLHTDVLRIILNYVVKIFDMFGITADKLVETNNYDEKMAELLVEFRNKIKLEIKSNSDKKAYFKICDEVREKLKDFGYIIDDTEHGPILRKLQINF